MCIKWSYKDDENSPYYYENNNVIDSYEIIINSGKKRYKVYHFTANNNTIEKKIYRIQRKRIGKQIKYENDGTIIYRSRMQDIQTFEIPISKEEEKEIENLLIPEYELFFNQLQYKLIYNHFFRKTLLKKV